MWLLLGWFFVGLGFIGAVLPIIPTVPFLLVAVFCFEKGSPRLHAWIMNHPRFGGPLSDWQKHRVIGWRSKLVSVGGLAVSLTYTCFFSDRPDWVKASVGIIGAVAIVFILSRRSYRPSGLP
jgi:uncharacterized membrane protein YbaN (DUF454 family)